MTGLQKPVILLYYNSVIRCITPRVYMAKKDRIEYLDYGLFDKEVAEIVENALKNSKLKIPFIKVYTTCIAVPFGVHDVKITVTEDKKVGIVYVADNYIQSFYTEGWRNRNRKAMYEYFEQEFFQDGIDKYQTMRFDSISQFRSWFTFEKLLIFFKVLNKFDQALGDLCKIINHTELTDPIFDKNSDEHHTFVKNMMSKLYSLKNELILLPVSTL